MHCARTGCDDRGALRPILMLVLRGRDVGYRIPLPVVLCPTHRQSFARFLGSAAGRRLFEGALARYGAPPDWAATTLRFTRVTERSRGRATAEYDA